MSKRSITKYALIAAVVTGVAAGAAFTRGRGQDVQTRPGANEEHRRAVDAARQGGIREAAKIKGSFVVTDFAKAEGVYSGLDSLASHSDVVIVGTPSQNVCRVTPDGRYITTDYEVVAQEVFKGRVRKRDTVKVSLPGGRVQFEDGTSAEVRVPDFRKMEDGKTYVLFLSERKDNPGVFQVVGGPQGLFELSADNVTVKSHGRGMDLVAQKYKDKDQREFLKEVREATRKWSKAAVCCN
jgi:hypothetical protein